MITRSRIFGRLSTTNITEYPSSPIERTPPPINRSLFSVHERNGSPTIDYFSQSNNSIESDVFGGEDAEDAEMEYDEYSDA